MWIRREHNALDEHQKSLSCVGQADTNGVGGEDSSSGEGGSVQEQGSEQPARRSALLVDDWLRLRVPEGRPKQLAVLRCRLNAAFAFKVL